MINIYSITDYCKDGDLYSVVMNDISIGGRVKENDARHWFRQLLLSLHNLQQKGICHRNLTLENIMVNEGKCKIIDFALAVRIPYDHPHNQGGVIDVSDGSRRRLVHAQGQGGELTYMVPEVLRRNAIVDGFAVDLWAVGCILFIILVGHMPINLPHPSDEQFLTGMNGIDINGQSLLVVGDLVLVAREDPEEGTLMIVACPSDCARYDNAIDGHAIYVYGIDTGDPSRRYFYTEESPICMAAIHSGLLLIIKEV